uniref:Uncharacterized protein n=1 Tax=Aegilops tauschii subsp. strangulata TaxID=200361 RepID=A0A453RTD0_AEGTS
RPLLLQPRALSHRCTAAAPTLSPSQAAQAAPRSATAVLYNHAHPAADEGGVRGGAAGPFLRLRGPWRLRAIPPPLPRRPRRLGRRRIRHRPEERHLRRTWVSPSSTVGGPLLAGGDRPHPSRRKRGGGQQPTSRIPM